MKNVLDSYRKAMLDDEFFREMIACELANHEAGYTGEYGEALDALGISFGYLPPVRQKIVIDELNKLIRRAE